MSLSDAYRMAQRSVADLKSSIHELLAMGPSEGLTNAEIGRALGIYTGHVGHEGHVSRTMLSLLEALLSDDFINSTKSGLMTVPARVTTLPQKKHSPSPSISHTIRPQAWQLVTSLCSRQ